MEPNRIASICVIGDVILDVVAYITDARLSLIEQHKGAMLSCKIDMLPGGTAVHAAVGAVDAGFRRVSIIGKVGCTNEAHEPDIAAAVIDGYLQGFHIERLFSRVGLASTGIAVMSYLADNTCLVTYDRGANEMLCVDDITASMRECITSSDVVFVSGYTFLHPTCAEAVMTLMDIANTHGKLVVVDVVPHKLYTVVDPELFRRYTYSAHVLVAELSTIQRFLTSDGGVESIGAYLLKDYFAAIVRTSDDVQHIYIRARKPQILDTGYSQAVIANRRGYLDRATIGQLPHILAAFLQNGKSQQDEVGDS